VGPNGTAINNIVYALAVIGGDLYVGGNLTDAGGVDEADFLARWSGSAWNAVGATGPGDRPVNGPVYALATSGSVLYAGGAFGNLAGIPQADNVARWNGTAWSALGSNGNGDGAVYLYVFALAVSNDDVYVGGQFTSAAGIPAADHVAHWNGEAWSALGSGGGALDDDVSALLISGSDLYIGGGFDDAAGIASADSIVRYELATGTIRQPDGRIRLGTGTYAGNDVYNTTGASQSRTGSAARGATVTFGISIQNDGSGADQFLVAATGAANSGYKVTYFTATTDITGAIVAGTYQTPSLAAGAAHVITARVKVKPTATAGSKVNRLVTITSVADGTSKDAVKLVAKRS
jgi:hypothetical protein